MGRGYNALKQKLEGFFLFNNKNGYAKKDAKSDNR